MKLLLMVAVVLAAVHFAHHAGEPRSPLLIQAGALVTAPATPTVTGVPEFPPQPTWRLYSLCRVDRRNVPILEERTA